jgi:hypothetical protein
MLYGATWTALLMLLMTAGVVSGGLRHLLPIFAYAALPVGHAGAHDRLEKYAGNDAGFGIALVIGLYLVYQLLHASQQHK